MKIWIIGIVMGLLVLGSFVLVSALQEDEVEEESSEVSLSSCSGGCSAGNTCGNPSCGVQVGKSCGCQR